MIGHLAGVTLRRGPAARVARGRVARSPVARVAGGRSPPAVGRVLARGTRGGPGGGASWGRGEYITSVRYLGGLCFQDFKEVIYFRFLLTFLYITFMQGSLLF